jgi:fructuronate reductase
LGAFFRAHGAIYVAEAMRVSGGDWGILGVSLVRPDQRDALAPQDFAYTAVELGPERETPAVVDVVQNVLVAREDPQAVLAAMTDPAVRIVSLTITEKGYCMSQASGRLNPDHPDIQVDLAHPTRHAPRRISRARPARRGPRNLLPSPRSAAIICRRTAAYFVASCSTSPRLIDPTLADWIAAQGAFPSTMVDRIVPATKPEDIERLAAQTGVLDLSPVMHEPFRQWVVEDGFVGRARPDLGPSACSSSRTSPPFELMKLRMLNGAHSALAYLGYLTGHKTIAEVIADQPFAAFARRLWRAEIMPSFTPPEGVDLATYAEALLDRFRNPAIHHLTWQIAMDGSQKLPQRILGTFGDNRAAGRPSPGSFSRSPPGCATSEAWTSKDTPSTSATLCRAPEGPLAQRRDPGSQGLLSLVGAEVFPGSLAADPVVPGRSRERLPWAFC